uniref:Uncharacterized protein n=1 Tax=Tanacetum cinerariifolium TaxID=118510 RepID=A0A6L2NYF0_TANCI|nr:hypothetical protein [Tanacetum cinerariifolium]
MSSITAQQSKLNLELVPKEKRCSRELGHTWESSQSLMLLLIRCINLGELLLLSLIEVYLERQLEDFTYQINNRGHKKQVKMYYPQFTKVIIHYFLTKDKTVSRRNKIGMHTCSPEMRETKAHKTYLGYATGVTPPKKAINFKKTTSPKLTTVPASPQEPIKKSKRVKRPAKKSTNASTAGVVIRDVNISGPSGELDGTPTLPDRLSGLTIPVWAVVSRLPLTHLTFERQGIELLLDAALLEDAQLKKALKKSKKETHKLQVSGSSEGADFKSEVPDESKAKSFNTSEGTGVKPGVPDVSKAYSSESDNGSWRDSDDDNESDDNDDKGSKNDDNSGKGEVKMTDATRESGSQEKSYEQVVEDEHVTLVDEVASLMNIKVHQEESSTQAPPILLVPVTAIPETSTVQATTVHPTIQPFTSIPQQSTPTPEPTTEPSTTLIPDLSSLFRFDHRVSTLEKELSQLKQNQEGNLGNDDEELVRVVASKCNWFTKPKKPQEPTDPDWNVGKTPQQRPTQSWLMTLAATADKPSQTFNELMSTPIDFSTCIMNGLNITNLTQETLLKLDWDNPEGGDYLFDLTKPTPLVMNRNCQIVLIDWFFNNDLKYLQGGISTMTYTTSTKKSKVTQYDLPGIEDMVPKIWSPVKVAYDKHALWGISHWRKQHKTFNAYARGLESSHDVYSTKRIMAVTRVKNMLILIVQNRLNNLSGDDVFDFSITLQMFTRSMVIQKRVEDLQLGVKSYMKKINVTKPETTRPDIRKRDPYTPHTDPQGFIYVDNQWRNRLMRSDELYKFSDGTLTRL